MIEPYIKQYQKAIERGWIEINGVKKRLVVGWKIKKVVDILCSYLEDERFIFEPGNCYKRFKFEESFCLQGYAPFYNQPIQLMLWQKAFFEAIYSFKERSTGHLLINEALLEVGRKNGKSTMVAADMNANLFVGGGGKQYIIASNDEKQCNLIFSETKHMRQRLDVKNEITNDNLVEIRNNAKNIKITKMSSKTQNKDGRNCVAAVMDECHDCKDDEIAEAVKRSMSTHDERLFIMVSTNGFINDGFFDKQLRYANAWINGEIDNPHYLPFLYEQDEESEIWSGDVEQWQKANPSLIYGVKKYAFIEDSILKAQLDRESRIHMLTKDFNIKVGNSTQWLESTIYDYEQDKWTLEEFRRGYGIGAVDLSDTGDLTCASIMFTKDNMKYVHIQFFIPESKIKKKDSDNGARYEEWSKTINPVTNEPYVIVCQGNRINQKDVADWYQRLRRNYEIEPYTIGYDRWHSDMFLHWCDKKTGYGFRTEMISQGKYLSFPMKMVERDLTDRLINYGNNPVLKYCFSNTSVKIVGDSIQPEKMDGLYSRKIDGVVTLIMSYATLDKVDIGG
ncbi:MAG: terminase large subunit [Methanobrevibacter sp.]|nr:terminase large subunit [Methanobrevibacter sp.]